MTEQINGAGLVYENWEEVPNIRRFCHEAMATTFEVIIAHEDERFARQAAFAAFEEVDRLEAELSRFVPNSDVARINKLPVNQPLRLGLDTFECLKLSEKIYAQTEGAFDVTVGPLLECWRDKDKKPRTPSQEQLDTALQNVGTDLIYLDEDEHTITMLAGPVQVDLGGVGKGYTVDRMAEMLREWTVEAALISGGYSSVLALDAPEGTVGWPVTLSNPDDHKQILIRTNLKNRGLGSSGLQQGRHIIDPRSGQPVEGRRAAWSSAPDAGTADALSTAFMIMGPEQIEQYCTRYQEVKAVIVLQGADKQIRKEEVLRFGFWDEEEFVI